MLVNVTELVANRQTRLQNLEQGAPAKLPRKGKIDVKHLIERSYFNDAESQSTAEKMDCLDEKFWELNPRFVDDIQRRGIRCPINYNPYRDTVYNGHHRLLVAWLLGIEEIDYDMDCWDDSWPA